MHVNADDFRPPSVLRLSLVSSQMAAGGALAALLAHLGVPALFLFVMWLLAIGTADLKPAPPAIEEHVVEARFVRLGKKPDPDKLPQRQVPRKTTAPDKAVVVSKDMNPEQPPPEEKRPEEAEVDDLTRLGDRAQAFSEATDQELEGDPNGLAEGTEDEAQAGDLYAGMLVAFFKNGWTIPTTLGDTRGLVTTISVEITADLHVGPSEITKSSNVALFDQSVEDRLAQLRAAGATVPVPPPEVAERFLGKTIAVRFNGRGAD
jgi:outer membrane biosynthesis protein TonB